MPEFDIGLLTVRSGSRILRVTADDVAVARGVIQGECDTGQCHCPPEWCTDEVETTILHVRQVVLDDVAMVAAAVGPGALYADDTLETRARQVH